MVRKQLPKRSRGGTQDSAKRGEDADYERRTLEEIEIHKESQAVEPAGIKAANQVLPIASTGEFAEEQIDSKEIERDKDTRRSECDRAAGRCA